VIALAVRDSLIADVGGEDDTTLHGEQFFEIFRRNPDMYHAFDTEDEMKTRSISVNSTPWPLGRRRGGGEAQSRTEFGSIPRLVGRTGGCSLFGLFSTPPPSYIIHQAALWARRRSLALFGNCVIML
jgi:hypothetical protein